ncbi:MAG: hypothetical protein R2708_07385 [Vicinamibacterales bacterium]
MVVAALWTAALALETGSSGIAVLGWFATVVVAYATAFLVGAVVAWRRPALRRRAALVMGMPLVGGAAPLLLRTLAGAPLAPALVRNGSLLAVVCPCALGLVFPRRVVRWIPHGLFRSRGWNLFLLGALAVGWSGLIAFVGWLTAGNGMAAMNAAARSGSSTAAAYAVLLASSYGLLLGVGSVLTGAWGWLGLRGGVDGALGRLHFLQCVGAGPGILTGAATWVWLAGQR